MPPPRFSVAQPRTVNRAAVEPWSQGMNKPLPAQKVKPLLEAFSRRAKELDVYDATALAPTQLKELLKSDKAWLVTERMKWE